MPAPQQISYVPPTVALRAVGAVVAVVSLATGALLLFEAGSDDMPWAAAIAVVALCTFAVLTGLQLALVGAGLQLTETEVRVMYRPLTIRIPRTDIVEVMPGDRVDGVGFGYGYRWEGRGRRAVRVGGPMVTVVYHGGRVGVSVDDTERVRAALTD